MMEKKTVELWGWITSKLFNFLLEKMIKN